MKAYIMGKSVVEVDVKWRSIDSSGLAIIVDTSGVRYETHLSNVIFVGVEK
jgi:hypothetical protein